MAWKWPTINEKKTTLSELILLLNVQLTKLTNQIAPLFSAVESVDTFPNGGATPSIFGSNLWKTQNTVATVISDFEDGTPAKTFTLWAGDANTTVKNNANIKTKSGADIVMTATDIRQFVTLTGIGWREV